MQTAPTLELNDLLVRLIEMGHGRAAVPAVETAVLELFARDPGGSFELDDLLQHMRESGKAPAAELVLLAIADLKVRPPHTDAVRDPRWHAVNRSIDDPGSFPFGATEPGLDERVVEYPWLFDRLRSLHPAGMPVLDAGSVTNHEPILRQWEQHGFGPLSIVTLCYEGAARVSDTFRYEFADLRHLPYRDHWFSTVVCLSTIEHVGMDNSLYGAAGHRRFDPDVEARNSVIELSRVLAPAGTLLLSVPFGEASDRGWFRVFDERSLRLLTDLPCWSESRVRVFRCAEGGWREVAPEAARDAGYNEPHAGPGKRTAPAWVSAAEAVALVELRLVR
jgi:SAM-dependent methyltransferase